MKKYLMLSAILFCFMMGSTYAQEDASSGGSMDLTFTAALLFGNGNFMDGGLDIPSSPTTYWNIEGTAPYANTVSANSNYIINMAGVEARVFINDEMAVRLTGGAIIRNTPARDNVPGVIDPSAPNVTWIPDYAAVTADNRFDANIIPAFEYHLGKSNNLAPYAGIGVPIHYARWSQYNPSYDVSSTGDITITDVDTRHVEMLGFGVQLIAGVDYFLKDNFYIGLEIKPFSYLYAYNTKFPAPGLESLQADTHTYGFFTQPFFKIGFML